MPIHANAEQTLAVEDRLAILSTLNISLPFYIVKRIVLSWIYVAPGRSQSQNNWGGGGGGGEHPLKLLWEELKSLLSLGLSRHCIGYQLQNIKQRFTKRFTDTVIRTFGPRKETIPTYTVWKFSSMHVKLPLAIC